MPSPTAAALFRAGLVLGAFAVFWLVLPAALANGNLDLWRRDANAEAAARHGPDCGTAAMVLSGLPSNPSAGFDDALRLVVERVLDGQTGRLRLSAASRPLASADSRLATWGEREVPTPWPEFWFFFADDDPIANWAHPCRYVFVARDLSAIAVLRDRTPPNLPLQVFIPFDPPPAAPRAHIPSEAVSARFSLPAGSASNCFAVLISGGCSSNLNAIRYWGDVSAVYSTLTLAYGYPKTNVFALVSDGTNTVEDASDALNGIYVNSPVDLDGDGIPDVLGEASAANVSNVFLHLQGLLRPSDQLFVFVTDHGNHTSGGAERDSELNLWNGEVLRDSDLEALAAPLPCPVIFAMEQCFGGGFVDNLRQPRRAIATAASHDTTSSSGDSYPYFNQWCHEWIAAMRGFYPATNAPWENAAPCHADFNGDGLVSFREASHHANANAPPGDSPMYADNPPHFGSRLFLFQPSGPIPNLADHVEISPFRIPPATNVPFAVSVVARDPLGAVATNFSGPVALETVADVVNPGLTVGKPLASFAFLLRTAYRTVRTQVIYPAAQMGGPRTIDRISLHVAEHPIQTLRRFAIRLRHSDLENYPMPPAQAAWETDWTPVYMADTDIPSNGWFTLLFTNSFAYDGSRSLMVDFSFSNDFAAGDSSVTIAYEDISIYRSIHRAQDGESGDPLLWAGTNPPASRTFMYPHVHFGPLPYQPRVAIVPTNLADFSGGAWTGSLAALDAADNVRILVKTTNAYWDTETPRFPVREYLFDLAAPRFHGNGLFSLGWGSGTGYTYRVMRSSSLPAGFVPIATNLQATPPINTFTGAAAFPSPSFFRVEEE